MAQERKEKRPWQDETLTLPFYRQLYSALFLGRAEPDPRANKPLKLTQALGDHLNYESYQEWNARLNENTIAAEKYIAGELEKELEVVEKLNRVMQGDLTALMDAEMAEDLLIRATGEKTMEDALFKLTGQRSLEEAVDGMTADKTMELMDVASQVLADVEVSDALGMIDDFLAVDMFTSYGFHPPIINLPIRIAPAVLTLLLGNSCDNFYYNMDPFTMECNPFLENWHYEDGVQMARQSFWYENALEILDRRHMRTGEKFRYLNVQRPPGEGGMMARDILADIRNEKTPEYNDSIMYAFPYNTIVTPDCQSATRSLYDFICTLLNMIFCRRLGWPIDAYVAWVPRPSIVQMGEQLPIDMLLPRFLPIFTGITAYIGKYNLTHLETTMETIGAEAVVPGPTEAASAYVRYGMDMIRYPPPFVQSIRVYGQDAHMIDPTIYPCPEKKIMTIEEANNEIENARKEHPEWMTDIKGYGR
ncbi:MAG: hypothetical protein SVM80_02525 [Halobacteriota archaeon]|nr:hypothetical protein [Halobacteriota archaeon]